MDTTTFTYSTYIQTTPEQLWQALTSPEFTVQYWQTRRFEGEWKSGAPIKMVRGDGGTDFEGTVIDYNPYKLLSYSGLGSDGTSATKVSFEIIPLLDSQVRLNVIHEGLPDSKTIPVREGWYAIISSLKTMLETGKPLDFSWWKGNNRK